MRIVLSSNASLKHFPNNSLTQFTVQLPSGIDFTKGDWECSLQEIQFLKSWYNVPNSEIRFIHSTTSHTLNIDEGYYNTVYDLVDTINKGIDLQCTENTNSCFKFDVNDINQRVNVVRMNDGCIVTMDKSLSQILGFNEEDIKILSRTANERRMRERIQASQCARMSPIYNIFVYTDILQPNLVSDTEAPLLRTVPVSTGNHWTYHTSSFTKLQYIPVVPKHTRTITVYLRDGEGRPILFNSGRTTVTLHFRRVF